MKNRVGIFSEERFSRLIVGANPSMREGAYPLDRGGRNVLERWAKRKTIRHSSALAFCLPERRVLSCAGVEGCGLVLQQLPSAFSGRVPSLLLGKVPARCADVCWSSHRSSPQITNRSKQIAGGFIAPELVQGKAIEALLEDAGDPIPAGCYQWQTTEEEVSKMRDWCLGI